MSDDFQNSLKWIEDTKKKFTYFTSPVAYLTQALNLLEKSCREAHMLRESFLGLKHDLSNASSTVTYQRDDLIAWIDSVLNSDTEKTK